MGRSFTEGFDQSYSLRHYRWGHVIDMYLGGLNRDRDSPEGHGPLEYMFGWGALSRTPTDLTLMAYPGENSYKMPKNLQGIFSDIFDCNHYKNSVFPYSEGHSRKFL